MLMQKWFWFKNEEVFDKNDKSIFGAIFRINVAHFPLLKFLREVANVLIEIDFNQICL